MPRYDSGIRYDDPAVRYDQPDLITPKRKKTRIMASNRLPDTLEELISLAEDAADGAHQLEATIGLQQNKEAGIRADLAALVTKKTAYDTALAASPAKTTALTVARSNARGWLTMARDNFKTFLGAKPSQAWEATGWSADSIAVPSTSDRLLPLLQSVGGYLTANPAREVAAMLLTAARATTLHTALSDAREARNVHDTLLAQTKNERDAAADTLRTRLRGLIDELMQLLDPLSPHWLTFGLKRPGAPDSPAKVQNTRVTSAGPGTARVQSDPAARAEYYQYWKLVVGVDEDFELAGSADDPDKTFDGLTAGATVKFKMRAINETGPGPFGSEAQIVVS